MQQYYVHYEIKRCFISQKPQLQKIILTLDDYQKCKIGTDEVSINDSMFDVKSISIRGDHVELLVLKDSKEDNILKKIKDFAGRANQPNNGHLNKLQQLFSWNYLSYSTDEHIFIYPLSVYNIRLFTLDILSNFPEISTPPPKLV